MKDEVRETTKNIPSVDSDTTPSVDSSVESDTESDKIINTKHSNNNLNKPVNKKEGRQRQISIEAFDSAANPVPEPTRTRRSSDAANNTVTKTTKTITAIKGIAADNVAHTEEQKKQQQEQGAVDPLSKPLTRNEAESPPCSLKQDSPHRATPHNTTKPASSPLFSSESLPHQSTHSRAASPPASSPEHRLWLAAHCGQLAIEITQNAQARIPVIVVDEHERHPRILAVNTQARQAGLVPGMSLSVAHTLLENLAVTTHDPVATMKRLHHMADLCSRFTSAVSVEPPDILLLEVLGSIKLFGSLQSLKQHLVQAFHEQGHIIECTTSPSPSAAILMARAGIYTDTVGYAATVKQIRSIAICHLELTDKQHRTLSGMGLRTVNDLMRLPRDGLARRISPALLNHMDRIQGFAKDPRHLYSTARRFHIEHCFDEPVSDVRLLLIIANRLIDALVKELIMSGSAVHELNWTMTHTDYPTTTIRLILTHAVRHAQHLQHLVKERFERLQLEQGIDTLMLTTSHFESSQGNSLDLFSHLPAQNTHAAFALLDRLRSRLGERAVAGLGTVPEHRPEQAWKVCKPLQIQTRDLNQVKDRHSARELDARSPDRPVWLLRQPLPLPVKHGFPQFRGALALLDKQERIESGWWDKTPVQRDYYVATNPYGERLWVYQDLKDKRNGGWYLHGLFA